MAPSSGSIPSGARIVERLRNYFLAGLLVLGPTAITLWVFFRLLNWVDNLLGRYLRFAALDYHRVPGLGLLATILLLTIVGWVASWIGARPGAHVGHAAHPHSGDRDRLRLDQVAGRGVPEQGAGVPPGGARAVAPS